MKRFDDHLFEMAEREEISTPEDFNERLDAAIARGLEKAESREACGQGVRPARRARSVRAALAAAAACLLAGTALAVFSAGGFKSVEFWSGENLDGEDLNWYGVEGGDYRHVPVEELSDDVRETAERNPVTDTTKYFKDSDWSAAQEYSGVTLPRNRVIDELEIGTSYVTVSANSKGPTCLRFWQGTPGLGVTMSAEVHTELLSDENFVVKRGFPAGELSSQEYVSENGLSVLIVHLEPGGQTSESDRGVVNTEQYMADFLLDGFRYHIEVEVDGWEIRTPEEALDTLHEILDGFAA